MATKKSEPSRQEPGRKGTETFNQEKGKTQEPKQAPGQQQGRMGKSDTEFGKSQQPSSRQEKSAFFEKEDRPDYTESSKRRAQQEKNIPRGFESENLEEGEESPGRGRQQTGASSKSPKTQGQESKQQRKTFHPTEE